MALSSSTSTRNSLTKALGCMLVASVMVATLSPSAAHAAATYTVGGAAGWKIFNPAGIPATVKVGSKLVFKYNAGAHNIVLYPGKTTFDSCASSGYKVLDQGAGFRTYTATLSKKQTYYFACTRSSHCFFGQKFAVKAV